MQVKLLLTLLFITILTIIISSGCGGGSGTTQPASLATPTPNMTDNMAYITIKVKWPEQGIAGKLIMSSGNEEKEITASMPPDAEKIELKIFNYKDKNENDPIDFDPNNILAEGKLSEPETQITIPVQVPIITNPSNPTNPNILPAIPVKVWAGCFSDPNTTDPNTALSTAEHYMVLRVGNQTANLQLGDYELTVDPNNVIINLSPLYKRNTNMISDDTPVPEDTPTSVPGGPGSANITAKLNIVYPTPAPNSTATPKPPKPAEGKLIKFEIVEGNDAGTYLSLAGETGSIVRGFTLADGTSTATLTTSTAGHKTIKASFQSDSNDPNSIYSDYCYVTVMAPPPPTPLPTETPEPTFTPTPTLTPTITPTPTQTPTPPPFPAYVLGTWNEITSDVKQTGNTFTIEFTEPYTYTKDQTKVKITRNGDTNNVCYAWVWPGDDNLTQMVWNYEEPNIIMPNGQRYKTCFGIVRHYMKLVPGSSSTICWTLHGNGTYMCYWSK